MPLPSRSRQEWDDCKVRLCLDCRRAWPADALICGTCRKSFNGRLCQHNHLSPPNAACCTTCGSRRLLQPARSLNLRFSLLLLSWVVGLIALKVLFANFGIVLGFVFGMLGAAFSFVLGQSVGLVFGALIQYVVVLTLIWVAFRRILGAQSIPVRAIECLTTKAVRAVPKVTRWGWDALSALIGGQGRRQNSPPRGDHR